MKQIILSIIVAFSFLGFSTGCASGGYKITRGFSRWVNKQHIIIRIVLYIFLMPVWGITLLIDAVVFNTMDFWQGRVSQGTYNFEENGKQYWVKHELQEGTQLKKSTIRVMDLAEQKVREIIVKENRDHTVEVYLDGKLRRKASGVKGFALISDFDEAGLLTKKIPVDLKRNTFATKNISL